MASKFEDLEQFESLFCEAKNHFIVRLGGVTEIFLSGGEKAIVDTADMPLLSTFRWHCDRSKGGQTKYTITNLVVGGRKVTKSMHSLLLGSGDGLEADHINGDGLDNRRANLRLVTHAQNQHNLPKVLRNPQGKKPSSQFKGVHWSKHHDGWVAMISIRGKTKNLGVFNSEILAAKKYNEMALSLRGSSARVNQLPEGV